MEEAGGFLGVFWVAKRFFLLLFEGSTDAVRGLWLPLFPISRPPALEPGQSEAVGAE